MPANDGAGSLARPMGLPADGAAETDASQGAAAGAEGGSPRSGLLEASEVRAMFDRIAGVYDAMNGAMSLGLHRRWRERAADLADVGLGCSVLDVAAGTGDLAFELARRVGPHGEVIGSDFSEAMLMRAREKARLQGVSTVRFEQCDAMELPYEDDRFDAATVGFGARNFSDLRRGLAEMARVVRPGGKVVVLEITTPRKPPLSTACSFWFDEMVPLLGKLVSVLQRLRGRAGRRERTTVAQGLQAAAAGRERAQVPAERHSLADAYAYLPSSVKRFPAPEALARELASLGLLDIRWLLTAGGIIAIHVATVPLEGRKR